MKEIKNGIGLIAHMAVGNVAMQTVNSSVLPQGMKDLTNTGIGLGVVAHSFKGIGNKKKGGWL